MADEKEIKVEQVEETANGEQADNTQDKDDSPLEQFFYHQRRALEETGKALDALLPPGFKEHSAEASREFARGFRVLVDAAIDELKAVSEREEAKANTKTDDDDDDDDRPSSTGKTKVKVEVD